MLPPRGTSLAFEGVSQQTATSDGHYPQLIDLAFHIPTPAWAAAAQRFPTWSNWTSLNQINNFMFTNV